MIDRCWWGFVGFCGGLAAVLYVAFFLFVARFVGFNDIDEIHR
jgi:hypothetical protein